MSQRFSHRHFKSDLEEQSRNQYGVNNMVSRETLTILMIAEALIAMSIITTLYIRIRQLTRDFFELERKMESINVRKQQIEKKEWRK